MGGFVLCVESTARDVNSLLELHKVHPQVRNDVKRHLSLLIEKAYENVTVTQADYNDSPERVCRAIAADVINRALTVAIPRIELLRQEKDNAVLAQKLTEANQQLREQDEAYSNLEETFESHKKAHNYMLHSYFREVLILRHRINDLESQKKTKTQLSMMAPGASIRANSFQTSPNYADTLQAAGSCTKSGVAASERYNGKTGGVLASALARMDGRILADGRSPPGGAGASLFDLVDTSSNLDKKRDVLEETARPDDEAASPTSTLHAAVHEGRGSPQDGPAYDRSTTGNIFCSSPNAPQVTEAEMLHAISTTRAEDSVDAIFDYEEYVAILNGRRDTLREQFKQLVAEKNAMKQHLKKERMLLRNTAKYGLPSDSASLAQMEKDLLFYKTKASKLGWFMRFAVRPIKFEFKDDIQALRSDIGQLQKTYTDFFSTMQNLISLVQSRSDALVDIFHMFIGEVHRAIEGMRKDASSQTCSELFLSNGDRENELEAIFNVDLTQMLAGNDQNSDGPKWNVIRRYLPWRGNSVTLRARETLKDLQKLSDTMRRKRAFFLSKGGDAAEPAYRGFQNRDAIGERKITREVTWRKEDEENDTVEKDPQSWRREVVEGTENLVGEDVLKELSALRMQRVALRARRSNTVSRMLALDYVEEKSEQQMKTYDSLCKQCDTYERTLLRDGKRINMLLKLLATHVAKHKGEASESLAAFNQSAAEDDGDPTQSRRNAPFASPYLYDPDALRRAKEQSSKGVLYLPVGAANTAGANNFIVFGNEQIPLSTFFEGAEREEGILGPRGKTLSEIRTPYGAAVDYCIGVQRGLPIGDHFGPVYVKYDASTGAHHITNNAGEDLLEAAAAAVRDGLSTTDALREARERTQMVGNTMPMTQIIFPAPQEIDAAANGATDAISTRAYNFYSAPQVSSEACENDGSTRGAHAKMPNDQVNSTGTVSATTPPLGPIYLIPLTTPATEEERRRHGLGQTASSTLFSVEETGVAPLAPSYNQLLRSSTATQYPLLAKRSGLKNAVTGDGSPRVCRPPTEETEMFRIQSLSLKPPASCAGPSSPANTVGRAQSDDAVSDLPYSSAIPLSSPATAALLSTRSDPLSTTTSASAAATKGSEAPSLSSPAPSAPTGANTPPPIASFESALQRAKLARSARLERESNTGAGVESAGGWQSAPASHRHGGTAAATIPSEKYLRLRLPGTGRLAPLRPAAKDTAALQKKIRLPAADTTFSMSADCPANRAPLSEN